MRESGYIKLHRSMLTWEWWNDINTFRVFIYCLLKANWDASRFQGYEVPRGSFVTGLPTISRETGLSERQVRTALKHLKATGEVTDKTTSKFRIITIKNYDKYQIGDRQSDRQVTDKCQSSDSNIRNKEYKEGKKDIVSASPEASHTSKRSLEDTLRELVEGKQYAPELKATLKEWIGYRKEIKKPLKTETGFSKLLTQIDHNLNGHTEHEMAELINYCMAQQYQGILFDRLGGNNDRGQHEADRAGASDNRAEPPCGSLEYYRSLGWKG